MTQRSEYQYETILAMALYVKTGVWTLEESGEKPTKEKIIRFFQNAMVYEIAKEASGNIGFHPRRDFFGEITVTQHENGLDLTVLNRLGLACLVEGIWGSINGERLCLDIYAQGLDATYFRYISKVEEDFIPVSDIVFGQPGRYPNVRRFISMITSARQAQIHRIYFADEDGKGLLDYPEELRKKTIEEALQMG